MKKDSLEACVEALESDGFSGIFFYTKTENMRLAETNLFEVKAEYGRRYRHNGKQQSFRIHDEAGFVYVIYGKQMGQTSNLEVSSGKND